MAKWTRDEIKLARQIAALWEKSATYKQFRNTADKLMKDHENALREKLNTQIENGYQALLLNADRDTDLLARMLYRRCITRPVNVPQTAIANNNFKSQTRGRSPDTWGEGGAAKLVVYFCIEDQLRQMRTRGVARPKIRDAIARILKIKSEHCLRANNKAKINNYASRYSEVRKILQISSS